MDKMTPICQKGYSSTRYCQEVLIQVIEGIEKCNSKKIKGAVVSLDIKKAFDSLSHSYLQCVYKFYNFGPNLIKWITLLSTKRKACVILTGDRTTDFFDLERGNAQGDTISPFLFNLGYQLLLFKLDLCLQIEGTQRDIAARVAPRVEGEVDILQPTAQEVRNADPKVFAMADDCTLLVKMDFENLRQIVLILQNFEEISGLGCNFEKTSLMPVGNINVLDNNIIELGFSITNEIVLLGAKIKNTGTSYDANSQEILRKINKQINFWKRFNLSLPGRICVSKTFLYSQINYLGSFLPFSDDVMRGMSLMIENFVRGNLKIGKKKFYDGIEAGGLGLFKLNEYLCSQRCAWVRRAHNEDELWKRELKFFSNYSIFNLRSKNFNAKENPILHNIAVSFERFTYKFSVCNENFREMYIFDNPCFTFDVNHPNFLKKEFFTAEYYEENKAKIMNLRLSNIASIDGRLKNKEDFENESGLHVTDAKYRVLMGIAVSAQIKYGKQNQQEKKTDTLVNFCMRIKKGSKKYRKILTDGGGDLGVSSNVQRYAELAEVIIGSENSKRLNAMWKKSCLNNTTRTFIFKLHNNLLGLNSRVANFVRGHPRTCTFCDLRRVPYENTENTKHLFFDCPSVEQALIEFFTWLFNSNAQITISRTEYFVGFSYENVSKNQVLDLILVLVKKSIWDCKQRFCVPTGNILKTSFLEEYGKLFKNSGKVREITRKSDIFLNNDNIRF